MDTKHEYPYQKGEEYVNIRFTPEKCKLFFNTSDIDHALFYTVDGLPTVFDSILGNLSNELATSMKCEVDRMVLMALLFHKVKLVLRGYGLDFDFSVASLQDGEMQGVIDEQMQQFEQAPKWDITMNHQDGSTHCYRDVDGQSEEKISKEILEICASQVHKNMTYFSTKTKNK